MKSSPPTKRSIIDQGNAAEDLHRADGTISSEDPSASGNLDKIRDILFGEQARSHDRRFAQLEQHLIREASDLRSDLKRRFDELESYIKKEVDVVMGRLTQEQDTRSEAVTRLARELQGLAASLSHTACQLEAQATDAHARFQQQLMERTNELAADVRARHVEVTAALDHAVQDLRAEKTDRSVLAALLMEVSKRLAEDHSSSSPA